MLNVKLRHQHKLTGSIKELYCHAQKNSFSEGWDNSQLIVNARVIDWESFLKFGDLQI